MSDREMQSYSTSSTLLFLAPIIRRENESISISIGFDDLQIFNLTVIRLFSSAFDSTVNAQIHKEQ